MVMDSNLVYYINRKNLDFPKGEKNNRELLEESLEKLIYAFSKSYTINKLFFYGGRKSGATVPICISLELSGSSTNTKVIIDCKMVPVMKRIDDGRFYKTGIELLKKDNSKVVKLRIKSLVDVLSKVDLIDFDKLRKSIDEEIEYIIKEDKSFFGGFTLDDNFGGFRYK